MRLRLYELGFGRLGHMRSRDAKPAMMPICSTDWTESWLKTLDTSRISISISQFSMVYLCQSISVHTVPIIFLEKP